MSVVAVQHLTKTFKIPQKEPGFWGSLSSLFHRKYLEKKAVEDISFTIEEGELIGFIGPNGAGKTTTLKCLSCLLYPSSGQVRVFGHDPFQRKKEFLQQISLVMGQKNQLWWDVPPMETFLLNKEIYQISDQDFQKNLSNLVEILQVKDVLQSPVRNLSLGQRMKCELIAALIHQPKVVFLDEPTIGLDVVMQQNLRSFIKDYNQRYKATIILTSHYMQDVKELCERVIIIDQGKIRYDGQLTEIIKQYAAEKILTITFDKRINLSDVAMLGKVLSHEPHKLMLEVAADKTKSIAAILLQDFPVKDITIEEPKIEDVIREVFSKGNDKIQDQNHK